MSLLIIPVAVRIKVPIIKGCACFAFMEYDFRFSLVYSVGKIDRTFEGCYIGERVLYGLRCERGKEYDRGCAKCGKHDSMCAGEVRTI